MTENCTKMTSKTQKVSFIDSISYKIGQKVDFIDIKLFLNGHAAMKLWFHLKPKKL